MVELDEKNLKALAERSTKLLDQARELEKGIRILADELQEPLTKARQAAIRADYNK